MADARPLRVFLSYKSQDSNIVRFVAAWLQHHGIDCWFAENQVPLDGQEDRKSIVQAILSGITSSTHVLLFTNSLYACAEWCQIEFRLIRACGLMTPTTAAEIRMPLDAGALSEIDAQRILWGSESGETVPHLAASCSDLPDLSRLHRFLRETCGWPLPPTMGSPVVEQPSPTVPVALPVLGLMVPLPGWTGGDMGRLNQADDFEMVQNYRREVNGAVNLQIRTNRFTRETSPYPVEGPVDDIELRRQAYDVAREFCRKLPRRVSRRTEIVGLHLVFLGTRSHFAISYTYRSPALGMCAARKYVLVAWDDETEFYYELVLTFDVYGPLSRLTALSPMMESIVQSLSFSPAVWETFLVTNANRRRFGKAVAAAADKHPLSMTSGARLSLLAYPSGYFAEVPLESTRRLWRGWFSRLLNTSRDDIEEGGGWTRLTRYRSR